MRARQRAAQGLKVSTTQDSRGLVVKSSLCVEDGAIRVERANIRPPRKKHHKQVRKAPTKARNRKTGIIVTYLP